MSVAVGQFGDPAFAEAFGEHRAATIGHLEDLITGLAKIGPGARVVDLCCGPGLLASRLAERVGPGGEVIGVDLAGHDLPVQAQRPRRKCPLRRGDAYSLRALLGQQVDHVVATSAWQNFLLDKGRLAEQLDLTLPARRTI